MTRDTGSDRSGDVDGDRSGSNDPEDRAAYYEERAEGQERIAAMESDGELRDVALEFADRFRRRACEIRRGRG